MRCRAAFVQTGLTLQIQNVPTKLIRQFVDVKIPGHLGELCGQGEFASIQ
jgi:hypothetical protein